MIGTGGTTSNTCASVIVRADDVFLNGSSAVNGANSLIQTSAIDGIGRKNVEILAENVFVSGIGNGGEIHATGDILTISDFDILLRNGTSITTQNGSITLVVDNKAPESPEIDDGRFVLDQGTLIQTSGPVRLFTARRIQNSINGPINGANFSPGELFVNSTSEVWGTYFPDDFGGFPFTIFYKTGLPTGIYNELGRTFAEMFQNLHPYDELLFDCKCFLFGYDRACYDQLFHPKGMVSSFDLFGDETREMLRQKYRNYHTKYVESF